MSQADYRVPMTAATFDAIPWDPEDPIDHYYEVLIDRNERIGHEFFESADRLRELTRGQQLLIRLGTFDGQVRNGGLTQYLWNCPESVFDAADDIEFLGETKLIRNYERAVEALVGKKDRWLALRHEWAKGQDSPSWETFRASYDLLDLGWFDKAYFDRHGYNWRREWVLEGHGLGHALMTKLAEYVRAHRDEFITGSPPPPDHQPTG